VLLQYDYDYDYDYFLTHYSLLIAVLQESKNPYEYESHKKGKRN